MAELAAHPADVLAALRTQVHDLSRANATAGSNGSCLKTQLQRIESRQQSLQSLVEDEAHAELEARNKAEYMVALRHQEAGQSLVSQLEECAAAAEEVTGANAEMVGLQGALREFAGDCATL